MERVDFFPRVDVVLDCRLIRGGSMSMSFDDSTYNIGLLVYGEDLGLYQSRP